jgi:hypothetical protein
MSAYSFRISLRITHPSIDPGEITAAVSLTPEHVWRAGEPRTTPKGMRLNGVRDESYWTARLDEGQGPGCDLTAAIAAQIDRVAPHHALFRRLPADGGHVEFFVGWFIDGMAGGSFDANLLARLGELGIDLSRSVYSTPEARPSDSAS